MIEERCFKTVKELFNYFAPWNSAGSLYGYIFRGLSQETYKLIPTALRLEENDLVDGGNFWKQGVLGKPIDEQFQWQSWQINAEYMYLREFYREADRQGLSVPNAPRIRKNFAQDFDPRGPYDHWESGAWLPDDLYETAALAQHYGIPTRLLDWTYDLYNALYFAFRGAIGKEGNLAIWALNKEYLSSLQGTESEIDVEFITAHYSNNPNLNAQKGLFTLWPVTSLTKNQEFDILRQIGQFENPEDIFGQTISDADNERRVSQLLTDRTPLDELIMNQYKDKKGDDIPFPLFEKFVLPCSEAPEGCRILDQMGYSSSRIFPGYAGVAKQILERNSY